MKMNRPDNRNGVTLMLVMSIIVLFLLMGTTFMIVSNNFLKSARQKSKFRLKGDEGQVLVERALYDIIRGPDLNNTMSPLRGHSLLGDMYGYGYKARIGSASINGQFIDAQLQDVRTILDQQTVNLHEGHGGLTGFLHGLVLTVTSGEFTGLTTRIINHPTSNQVMLKPVWSEQPLNPALLAGADVVINGRPFSGTGAGIFNDPASGGAGPIVPGGGLAAHRLSGQVLSPNQVGRPLNGANGLIEQYLSRYVFEISGGVLNPSPESVANSASVNESYDAPDFQNMFLAGLDNGTIIPSFHEFDKRGATGIPFSVFNTNQPEVDNDGDGTLDSIWMDTGLPMQSDGSGRIYKPLVACLITDLDGKINVNAHGNLTQLPADRYRSELAFFHPLGNNIPTNQRHHGQGYGPPEIDLSLLFGDNGAQALMQGDGTRYGRYGEDGFPGSPGVWETWSAYQHFGCPKNNLAANPPGTLGRHFQSSPMDIHGRFAIGFPPVFAAGTTAPIGMPVMDLNTSSLTDEITDSAYELNLAPEPFSMPGYAGLDQPFSLLELERVYRQYDPDSALLPDRLWQLAQAGNWDPAEPALLTTDSYEVPTTFSHMADRLYQNLLLGGMQPANARNQVSAMIAPEMLQGLPLDINRPFGNGVDSNGNGAVDDAGDAGADGQPVMHPSGTGFKLDVDRNGVDDSTSLEGRRARNNLARYVYMLILLSTEGLDRNGDGIPACGGDLSDWYDFDGNGITNAQDLRAFRQVAAQWAINLVDFRDPDSIMTPFEVDLNPWNGWDVNGIIGTVDDAHPDRALVWGCERPELLITETFATHDRRTQDLDFPEPQGDDELTTDDPPDNDEDFDSHLLPNVSAFFELYNPWAVNSLNQSPSRDVYDGTGAGVDLQKRVNGTPVWRLLVVNGDDGNSPPIRSIDPDTDDQQEQIRLAASTQRKIYFVQPNAVMDPLTIGNAFSGSQVYFPEAGINVPPVTPGRYAVAGSAGVRQVGDRYDTYFGRRTAGAATDPVELETLTQRFSLNPVNSTVQSYKWENGNFVTETRSNVVAIPIGANEVSGSRNLGVSDPMTGYTVGAGPVVLPIEILPINDGFKYVDASDPNAPRDYSFDTPVDESQNSENWDVVRDDGLTSAFRTVHLQRLADPTRPYNGNPRDAEYNPYRTIDSNSVDLFSFNGVTSSDDPGSPDLPNTPLLFSTFERRSGKDLLGQNRQRQPRRKILFKTDLDGSTSNSDSAAADGSHHLNRELAESLGELNAIYNPADTVNTEGPFAWLTWNNRPYVSHLELANVPHTSSSMLTCKFDADETLMTQAGKFTGGFNVYNPPLGRSTLTGSENYAGHFGHLLNFYADRTQGSVDNALRLQPLMDLLAVPSRFAGVDEWLNPATTPEFTPPFDRISRYRNPGKINLNTITDDRVWKALMGASVGENGYTNPNRGVTFDEWKNSMNVNGKPWGNPYRSAESFNWVPSGYVVSPADAGLFRREDPENADSNPLFDYRSNVNQNDYRSYHNTGRNAYFKYDMRQRLGNLVTTRSSVFAIWITVGLFEVNPDGTVSDRELGSDSGEVRRHRGFFVLDRSIPVAFEPGKNHNVERAIRVSSYIE